VEGDAEARRKDRGQRTTIYIMTDLEGVAGVLNHEDWCQLQSRLL